MKRFYVVIILILNFLVIPSLSCRDVILEMKGAYFLPTSSRFKDCYKGSALYGPELTIQLKENRNWYAFASIDYYKQKGKILSLCDSTKLRLLPLALGIKYFIPIRDWANFYFGLGFQAEYMNKKNRRAQIVSKDTFWGYGGIAKVGTYIKVPKNFILDVFIDYSFVWTSKNNFYGPTLVSTRVNTSGAIFGASLGYRF